MPEIWIFIIVIICDGIGYVLCYIYFGFSTYYKLKSMLKSRLCKISLNKIENRWKLISFKNMYVIQCVWILNRKKEKMIKILHPLDSAQFWALKIENDEPTGSQTRNNINFRLPAMMSTWTQWKSCCCLT